MTKERTGDEQHREQRSIRPTVEQRAISPSDGYGNFLGLLFSSEHDFASSRLRLRRSILAAVPSTLGGWLPATIEEPRFLNLDLLCVHGMFHDYATHPFLR